MIDMREGIVLGAVMVMVGELGAVMLAWAFCVRPAPRRWRVVRGIFLFIVAATVVAQLGFDAQPGWTRPIATIGLGVMCLVLMAHNWRAAIGPGGDRCR